MEAIWKRYYVYLLLKNYGHYCKISVQLLNSVEIFNELFCNKNRWRYERRIWSLTEAQAGHIFCDPRKTQITYNVNLKILETFLKIQLHGRPWLLAGFLIHGTLFHFGFYKASLQENPLKSFAKIEVVVSKFFFRLLFESLLQLFENNLPILYFLSFILINFSNCWKPLTFFLFSILSHIILKKSFFDKGFTVTVKPNI